MTIKEKVEGRSGRAQRLQIIVSDNAVAGVKNCRALVRTHKCTSSGNCVEVSVPAGHASDGVTKRTGKSTLVVCYLRNI